MFRKRLLALVASAGLLVGGGTAAVLLTSNSAGATGTSHSLTGVVNSSTAVEGSAKVTFTCDDVSGAYALKVTNVQVIEPDHVTQWPTLGVAWVVGGGPPVFLALKQNKTNGLFGAKNSGVLSNIGGECFTSATFEINDGLTAGSSNWLWLTGTLT